jgi:mortality factor 4-like protein 1
MPAQSNETKALYGKDEKALCFHGELLYEAKITELRRSDAKDPKSPFEYRVVSLVPILIYQTTANTSFQHYKGWKNRCV